ncbi:phage major capsid protein [Pseudactinotalea suaedae]|uniref:phage major capsid protein n=1 Tax=Pseudactinotalea suaedae TaxID=1524924 RepID=UPI0012E1D6B1|nr:phage major capsid protein [Pseudactinotalea suaedae]
MTSARMRTLLDKRATAWQQVQDIQARRAADGYEPTKEDGESYTRSLDDVEKLSRDIEEEERSERLAAAMNTPASDQRGTSPRPGAGEGDPEDDLPAAYRSAFSSFLRRGIGRLNPDEQRMLEQGFVEDRALATTTGSAGGYTVPKEFLDKMTEVQKAYGGLMQHAEVIDTDSGQEMLWPTNDDTGNVGAIVAENTQVTEQDVAFGQASFATYMYTSKIVRASFQLLQDSGIDLDSWLARKLGERIARAAAIHFAVGTGSGQPQGLVTGLTKVVYSGTDGAITFDNLVDLEHSIDPAYRNGNQRYIIADSALRGIRKLKDGQQRPLWVPALAGGVPSTINGHPYTVDNSFAALAADSRSVVFGDIRAAYLIRRVRGGQVLRLTERYADYLQVGFLGFQRLNGMVQDTNAAAALVAGTAE